MLPAPHARSFVHRRRRLIESGGHSGPNLPRVSLMPHLRLSPIVSLCLATAACASSPPPAPAPAPAPARAPIAATPAPPSATGIWLGTLAVGSRGLRLQLRLDLTKSPPDCAIDSLDQHANGITCGDVHVEGRRLSLSVPAVRGSLNGMLSDDNATLNATWTQGGPPMPLVMTRQAKPFEVATEPMDAALAPVELSTLKEVLDKDMASALEKGDLTPSNDAGVVIGVVQHGERKIFTYGTAKPDSVFEIGSVTKTFTGLLLAQMAEQKKARLDEPVRALLPPGTVTAPASGSEITLLDLSAQRSGLPRMPDNFKPADQDNPYADYDKNLLYAFIAGHGVARPQKPEFGYSNVGVGLLGQALSERAKMTYEELLRKEITGPLGMRDTVVTLTPALRPRFIAGHDHDHKAAHAWELGALAGAGGVHSTAADMLTYLEAELHPDRLPKGAAATPEGKTLSAAIAESQKVRGDANGRMHIALNWMRSDETGSYWHNGATGGYSAFAIFNREKDFGVIVLFNTSIGDRHLADDLGAHVAQRLTGMPAVQLGPSGS
jgi:D-alanyl-D-alanine-carboxypeptidase/D-alanyl-D-alanine-endopeptidase